MYAAVSPFQPHSPRAAFIANAYYRVGVETGAATASPHRLGAMLLDGLLECLVQANLRSDAALEHRISSTARRSPACGTATFAEAAPETAP